MKRAIVTGGNGHLGFNLVKLLLARGYAVTATVRSLIEPAKTKHLQELGGVSLVEAELTDKGSLKRAIRSADVVFHTASPTLAWAKDTEASITRPIIDGTKNVFHAANENGIGDIVFTSSCSAMGLNASPENPIDESQWNHTTVTPLIKAKIQAELWAWDFATANHLRLNTICPTSMIGPGFFRHTATTSLYEKFLRNTLPPMPAMGFHIVDVRDVAEAHIRAFEKSQSASRYIVAGEFFTSKNWLKRLKDLEPTKKISKLPVPRSLLYTFCALDRLNHSLTGAPRQLTKDLVDDLVGQYQHVNTSRAKEALLWNPRSTNETLCDTLNWIKQEFLPRP